MFAQASRLKLRFSTSKGDVTVEDLWDLPLTSTVNKPNLDDIARGLFSQLKSDTNVSFVNPAQKSDATIQLKFDLVKHVIDVRLAENAAAATTAANKEKKQKLLSVLESKENEALTQMPVDELRKMIQAL